MRTNMNSLSSGASKMSCTNISNFDCAWKHRFHYSDRSASLLWMLGLVVPAEALNRHGGVWVVGSEDSKWPRIVSRRDAAATLCLGQWRLYFDKTIFGGIKKLHNHWKMQRRGPGIDPVWVLFSLGKEAQGKSFRIHFIKMKGHFLAVARQCRNEGAAAAVLEELNTQRAIFRGWVSCW